MIAILGFLLFLIVACAVARVAVLALVALSLVAIPILMLWALITAPGDFLGSLLVFGAASIPMALCYYLQAKFPKTPKAAKHYYKAGDCLPYDPYRTKPVPASFRVVNGNVVPM